MFVQHKNLLKLNGILLLLSTIVFCIATYSLRKEASGLIFVSDVGQKMFFSNMPLLQLKPRHFGRTTISGFTVIELLVAISIIAVLAAISLLAIGRMQKSGQSSASMANMRQIHTAILTYVAENDGTYPRAVFKPGEGKELSGQGGLCIYWRRMVWETMFPTTGAWDQSFGEKDAKTGSYRKVMWCPLMVSKNGFVNYVQGHGSYGLNNYFNIYLDRPDRKAATLSGLGQKEPLLMAGTVKTGNLKKEGTWAYIESANYPYDTAWFNMAYEYGSSGDKALAVFLDGHAKMLSREEGTSLQTMIKNDQDFQ